MVPQVVEKSEKEKARIQGMLKKTVMFAHLDEAQLQIVIDAFDEHNSAKQDTIITQVPTLPAALNATGAAVQQPMQQSLHCQCNS